LLRILKSRLEIIKLAKEWRYWSIRIARAARDLLGECEVYVFGSVVEGKMTGGSDVDILIISDNVPKCMRKIWELKAKIEEISQLPLYHPYEIHLVNKEEAEWYMRHIKRKLKVHF